MSTKPYSCFSSITDMCDYSEYCPYVILDVDGVMTDLDSDIGSYITHSGEKYGVSKDPLNRLMRLLSDTGAKVVISSNWRRFDETGPGSIWRNMLYEGTHNPLPKLKASLKSCWLCDLPKVRHITKSQALRMWFDENHLDPEKCKYVIFDDDMREGFAESEFKDHFIHTDYHTGLTDEDCEKAKEILNK
jgi:hypothetical protein